MAELREQGPDAEAAVAETEQLCESIRSAIGESETVQAGHAKEIDQLEQVHRQIEQEILPKTVAVNERRMLIEMLTHQQELEVASENDSFVLQEVLDSHQSDSNPQTSSSKSRSS